MKKWSPALTAMATSSHLMAACIVKCVSVMQEMRVTSGDVPARARRFVQREIASSARRRLQKRLALHRPQRKRSRMRSRNGSDSSQKGVRGHSDFGTSNNERVGAWEGMSHPRRGRVTVTVTAANEPEAAAKRA